MAARIRSDIALTKLRPPSRQAGMAQSAILLHCQGALPGKKLLVVQAPIGSGKTTLLTELFYTLVSEGETCTWLNLDTDEANPNAFTEHLALSLQQEIPSVGQETLRLLGKPGVSPEVAISCLINDLALAKSRVTLFCDNVHESETPETASLISYFLRYLPPRIRLVLASRRRLSPALSWVNNRDWCLCIDWNDLCLKNVELRAYMASQHAGLCLDDQEIAALLERTEGWVGALRLATAALDPMRQASQHERLNLIHHAEFATPLLEELMDSLPSRLQDFMRDTAPLQHLSPALCDAILHRADSGICLKELERIHFLAQRTDNEWLRYPKLLSTYFQSILQTQAPEHTHTLHAQAGQWFATRGLIEQALEHWLNGGETQSAQELLSRHGKMLLIQSGRTKVSNWLSRLPREQREHSPELCTLEAWCALFSGRAHSLLTALAKAQQARNITICPGQASESAEWHILQTLAACSRNDWIDTLPCDENFPECFPPDQALLRASAHLTCALAHRYRDQLIAAQTACRNASELAECHQLHHIYALALHVLAVIDLLQARPDRALTRLKRALQDEERPVLGLLYTLQAEALIDKGQDEEASVVLDHAIHLLEQCGLSDHHGLALVLRAGLQTEKNRIESAHVDLAKARSLGLRHDISRVLFRADLCEAALCLTQSALGEAQILLERAAHLLRDSGQTSGENVEVWQALRCAWLIASHRNDEAHDLALDGEKNARNAGRVRHCIDFLLLRAISLTHQPGQQAASRECIEQARQLAKIGGVSHPFRRLVPNLEALLHQSENECALANARLNLPSELHQREEQILRLLEQGLRNREIAAKLFLSDETIKWYLKRLYGNFAVENRVQLLAAVRKSGLLTDAI